MHGLVEEVIEQERLEVQLLRVCGGDVAKEDGLDDATSSPHASNAGVVQVPAELSHQLISSVL